MSLQFWKVCSWQNKRSHKIYDIFKTYSAYNFYAFFTGFLQDIDSTQNYKVRFLKIVSL